jgi:hypothetical protein
MEESKLNCDFCGKNYLNATAEDFFGRLEHSLSYTAANTFKYDRWHTLIVSRNHDTLHLTEDEIGDMFELAKEWLEKVYSIESMYTCPEMIWDAMPKGARHYGQINHGRNYFNDYLYIHQALDLTIPIGNAYIIVHLVS